MILVGIRSKDRRRLSRVVAFGSPASRGERRTEVHVAGAGATFRPDGVVLRADEMHGEIDKERP